jgi:hypothetical protein
MEATPTNSSNDETTRLLWRKKLLEDKDFHYDAFLSSLPKEAWNLIFSFLQNRDLTGLVAVSKSLYRFLHLNVPLAWKSLSFDGQKKYLLEIPLNERITRDLFLPRFSQLSELHFIDCELFVFLFFFSFSSKTPPPPSSFFFLSLLLLSHLSHSFFSFSFQQQTKN